MNESNVKPDKLQRRSVAADLVEGSPGQAGQWALAAPLIVYLAWLWLDLFVHYSPIAWTLLDAALGLAIFILFVVLPVGLLAHRLVTSFPRLFQNTGWDVVPLEPVRDSEKYAVKYVAQRRTYAPTSQTRIWQRAAQGWVYVEVIVILVGGVLLIPLFLSATRFGFGS